MPLKRWDAFVEAFDCALELFARHRVKEVCVTLRQFFSQEPQVFAPQFRILRGESFLFLPENRQRGVGREEANKNYNPQICLIPSRGWRGQIFHCAPPSNKYYALKSAKAKKIRTKAVVFSPAKR